jgi:hypothetical protein
MQKEQFKLDRPFSIKTQRLLQNAKCKMQNQLAKVKRETKKNHPNTTMLLFHPT